MDSFSGKGATERVLPADDSVAVSSSASPADLGAPELIGVKDGSHVEPDITIDEIEDSNHGWFTYFKTRTFWIVLVLGYIQLAIDSQCLLG